MRVSSRWMTPSLGLGWSGKLAPMPIAYVPATTPKSRVPCQTGSGGPRDVICHGAAHHERPGARVQPHHAAAHPAIEQGRADGDEPAGARIGIALEEQARQHAAHAVPHDVKRFPVRLGKKLLQAREVVVQAVAHGVVLELPHAITGLP